MQDTKRFWNNVAIKYAAKSVPNEEIYQKKLQLTQQVFNDQMKVLELGCGTGSTALIHAPKVAAYVGTDISDKMIDIAQEKLAQSESNNLTFKVCDVADALREHQGVDAVLAHSLLHLLPDPKQVIQDIHNTLQPGGYLIASNVCLEGALKLLKLLLPIGKLLGVMPGLTFYGKKELNKWLQQSGFTLVEQWSPEKSPHTSFIIAQKK